MTFSNIHKLKKKKRIGRGGKRGTYSGKGVKGQKSRAGRKMQPIIRELIKKYPKLRGYRQSANKKKAIGLNLLLINKNFEQGEKITPRSLFKKGLIVKIKNKFPEIKILAKGNINKKIIIDGCKVSKGARDKIEKVGGEIKNHELVK